MLDLGSKLAMQKEREKKTNHHLQGFNSVFCESLHNYRNPLSTYIYTYTYRYGINFYDPAVFSALMIL
jgi:hypothetical protein